MKLCDNKMCIRIWIPEKIRIGDDDYDFYEIKIGMYYDNFLIKNNGEIFAEWMGNYWGVWMCNPQLMLRTDFKDCTGKFIYEGDIISNQYDQREIVRFRRSTFFLESINSGNKKSPLRNCFTFLWEKFGRRFLLFPLGGYQIIGNIYENPELLKDNPNDN